MKLVWLSLFFLGSCDLFAAKGGRSEKFVLSAVHQGATLAPSLSAPVLLGSVQSESLRLVPIDVSPDASKMVFLTDTWPKTQPFLQKLLVQDLQTNQILWEMPTDQLPCSSSGEYFYFDTARFSEDSQQLLVSCGSPDSKHSLLTFELSGRLVSQKDIFGDPPLSTSERFKLSPTGQLIKSSTLSQDKSRLLLVHGDLDGGKYSCRCWLDSGVLINDTKTGTQLTHPDWIEADLHPNGNQVVALTREQNRRVVVWDLAQNKELFELPIRVSRDCASAIACTFFSYSAGGSVILTSNGGFIERWDAQTGEKLYLQGSPQMSPYPHQIITQYQDEFFVTDGEIPGIWSARTGQAIALFEGGSSLQLPRDFILFTNREESQIAVWGQAR